MTPATPVGCPPPQPPSIALPFSPVGALPPFCPTPCCARRPWAGRCRTPSWWGAGGPVLAVAVSWEAWVVRVRPSRGSSSRGSVVRGLLPVHVRPLCGPSGGPLVLLGLLVGLVVGLWSGFLLLLGLPGVCSEVVGSLSPPPSSFLLSFRLLPLVVMFRC